FADSLAAAHDAPDDRESRRGLPLIQAMTSDTDFFRQNDENFACLAFVRGTRRAGNHKTEGAP
ncbi:MAG: hypothetical protein WCS01_11740, partial [bacterium]